VNQYNGRNGNGYQPIVQKGDRAARPPNGDGRVSDGTDYDTTVGLWFQSAATGLYYTNRNAAGDVRVILLDGMPFYPIS
jgi:hypothetical protein